MADPNYCAMIQAQIQQIMGNMSTLQQAQDLANGAVATAQGNYFTAQAQLNQAQYLLNAAESQKQLADGNMMQAQSNLQMLNYMFSSAGCGT